MSNKFVIIQKAFLQEGVIDNMALIGNIAACGFHNGIPKFKVEDVKSEYPCFDENLEIQVFEYYNNWIVFKLIESDPVFTSFNELLENKFLKFGFETDFNQFYEFSDVNKKKYTIFTQENVGTFIQNNRGPYGNIHSVVSFDWKGTENQDENDWLYDLKKCFDNFEISDNVLKSIRHFFLSLESAEPNLVKVNHKNQLSTKDLIVLSRNETLALMNGNVDRVIFLWKPSGINLLWVDGLLNLEDIKGLWYLDSFGV